MPRFHTTPKFTAQVLAITADCVFEKAQKLRESDEVVATELYHESLRLDDVVENMLLLVEDDGYDRPLEI